MYIINKEFTLWLNGLHRSGKTTIAKELITIINFHKWFDEESFKKRLNNDPSLVDRSSQLDKLREEVQKLLLLGLSTIVSVITPLEESRQKNRDILGERYIEVFVDCSSIVCEYRDEKGLYKLAREEKLDTFIGVSQEFEFPLMPNIIVNTDWNPVGICVRAIETMLMANEFIIDGEFKYEK